jgi:hypothetical protein
MSNNQWLAERVHEANKFASDLREYLRNFKIDKQIVGDKSHQLDGQLDELDKLLGQLKGAQFNGNLLKFTPSQSKTDTIGVFEFERVEEMPKNQPSTVIKVENSGSLSFV